MRAALGAHPRYTALRWFAAGLIVAAALAFRLADLDGEPFWVDEAESAINALTILEHGIPTDAYLGLPIYENTSVQPWPGHPEYAFRDVSYSDNHLAVYHGWLPLYAIAAAFKASGIRPDDPNGPRAITYGLPEQKRRTASARAPSVLFGVLFVVFAFAAGKLLYGDDMAWAGLLLASLHPYAIRMSRQARYYSAEILLTTVCCVLAWLMVRSGRWKYCIGCGVAFVLLFHTHMQSFFAGGLTVALAAPVFVRLHDRAAAKLAAFGAIVAAGTVPWLMATGFYTHQARIPRAWPLLRFPGDVLRYPPLEYVNLAIGALFMAAMAWALLRRQTSPRVRSPLREAAPVVVFIATWILCGYATFFATIPAVSFTPKRLNLGYWGPALLLASLLCAAAARLVRWRTPDVAVASAIALALFLGEGHSLRGPALPARDAWAGLAEITEELKAMQLDARTKLYAAPNAHLIWTVYTGLPIQSMGPIRGEYLNHYPGDIVYIDWFETDDNLLSAGRIREAARRNGCSISKDAAEQWSRLLLTRDYRESMLRDIGARPETELEPVPDFARRLLDASRERSRRTFDSDGLELVTRGVGFEVRSWKDWKRAFLYRFAGDAASRNAPVNYAERLRHSHAVILDRSDVAIYRSRRRPPGSDGTLKFTFLRPTQPADVSCSVVSEHPPL